MYTRTDMAQDKEFKAQSYSVRGKTYWRVRTGRTEAGNASYETLRLVIEAQGLEERTDKRDYARVLKSAASRGLCRKTDIYKRSNIKGNNNIPRVMWAAVGGEVEKA